LRGELAILEISRAFVFIDTKLNQPERIFLMKLKNFLLALIFLSFAAAASAPAQSPVTGSLTGRIVSAAGRSIGRAPVTVMNLTTFETQTRTTNDFGYFRFTDLPIIDLYLVTVNSKRYSFTVPNQLVQFTALEHHLIFTADR
jgi:hypothetical protein